MRSVHLRELPRSELAVDINGDALVVLAGRAAGSVRGIIKIKIVKTDFRSITIYVDFPSTADFPFESL
jgi:hypothetical protein